MSEIKWIKLAADIFDNRKIKAIESMPDGDALLVIWLKLLCLAGTINDNGLIYITPEVAYTEQTIATYLNKPLPTVQLAFNIFQELGMLEIIDNVLHISNWEKYQNTTAMNTIREQTRQRVAAYRERQKLNECNDNVTLQKRYSNGNVTQQNKKEEIRNKKEDIKEDYKEEIRRIGDKWNETGLTKVIAIKTGSKRYDSLKARINDYGVDAILKAIDNVKSSRFLKGQNDKGWCASFDWFILPNNFIKVLEGNYNDKTDAVITNKASYDLDRFKQDALNDTLEYKPKK